MAELNIKVFLNIFLGKKFKIPPVYNVRASENNCGFICDLKAEGINFIGTGRAESKKQAKTNAANSFVAYLVQNKFLKVDEIPNITSSNRTGKPKESAQKAANGPVKPTVVNKQYQQDNTTKPFPVILNLEVENALSQALIEHRVTPLHVRKDATGTINLLDERLSHKSIRLCGDLRSQHGSSIDIIWSPPTKNWNPWIAGQIERGYFATASLDAISLNLLQRQENRLQSDALLQKSLKERKSLPIYPFEKTIVDAVYDHSVIVIRGNTGSGKTTQVCQYILDDYLHRNVGAQCSIIVTQPRRISAISVTERIAVERREEVGESVGFSVRFERINPRPYGSILFCTVGVLLRRLERGLRGVSHIIVDEVHERDTDTDFLLIVLRDLVTRHPELRVVLMSATIDTSLFSRYFGQCPVIDVPGRIHPVKLYYLEDCVEMLRFQPRLDSKKYGQRKEQKERNLNLEVSNEYSRETKRAMALISENDICLELVEGLLIHIKEMGIPGAVLIFLPGWSAIMGLLRHLRQSRHSSDYLLLPLHSMLPREDQRLVFQSAPTGKTKVILATNIAESSITIDDVVVVIDSCQANVNNFTSHNNMHNYATTWAAQSNLEQRRGRAGRVCPGYCFRLCSFARYQHLEKNLKAEILRTPLHQIVLAIKLLRLGSIAHFLSKAIETPPVGAIVDAVVMLREMKCLDSDEELTALGRLVARIPVEPSQAKMMIVGSLLGHGDAMCVLAAGESVSADVFHLGLTNQLSSVQRSLAGQYYSDHLALLSAFYSYERVRLESGIPALRAFCDAKGLSYSTLRTMTGIREQLRDLLLSLGFPKSCFVPKVYKENTIEVDTVVGLMGIAHYPNICVHVQNRKVKTADSGLAYIHKSSVNSPGNSEGNPNAITFPLPFFVFSEKLRSGTVFCKRMSLVTPIHLLLFGARQVQIISKGGPLVRLDGWIDLHMDPQIVSNLLALRPALDRVIAILSTESKLIVDFRKSPLINTIAKLCEFQAASYPNSKLSKT